MPDRRPGSPVAAGWSPAAIIAAHLAVLLGGGLALAAASIPAARWAGAIASGTSLFALSGLVREASYRRLARRRPLNDALGLLAGWPMLLPLSAWRAFEAAHHGATNGTDDPRRPLDRRGMLVWGQWAYVFLCHRHAVRTLRGRERLAYIAEVAAMFVGTGLAGAAVLRAELAPFALGALLTAMACHNLRIVAEHLDLPPGRFADTWQLVLPSPLSRWLLHADHHLEQHLRPDVRWSDLPLVRAEIDRGGFIPDRQRVTPARFAREVLPRRRMVAAPAGSGGAAEPMATRWAGRAAIRARRPQPNHPSRESVIRLAPE